MNAKDRKKVTSFLKGYIPYSELLEIPEDPERTIVQNKGGEIFSVFRIDIKDDKMDEGILQARAEAVCRLLSASFNHQFEFTLDFVRTVKHYSRKKTDISGELKNCGELLEKRRKRLESETFFENTLYFVVCYKPESILRGKNNVILTKEHLEIFFSKREQIITGFLQTGYVCNLLKCNELITYLYKSLACDFEEKSATLALAEPVIGLDEFYAKSVNMYPSVYPLLLNDTLHICCMPFALPRFTWADMASFLITISHPVRMVMKYCPRDKSECDEPIYRQRDKEKASRSRIKASINAGLEHRETDPDEVNIEAIIGKAECDEAIKHIHENNVTAGYVSINIITSFSVTDEPKLTSYKNELNNVLNVWGVLGDYNENANTERFLESVLIRYREEEYDNGFYALADNVADFFPVSATTLHYDSAFLKKITGSEEPLLYGKTRGSGLFRFSPCGNYGNFGHSLITGLTGGGKSTTLCLLANEWLKYPNTKVVYLDMGLSMLRSVQENGGKVFFPMVDKTSFCPFKNAKDNEVQVLTFLESIALANNITLESREINAISSILRNNMPYGNEDFETFYAIYKGKVSDSAFTGVLEQYVNVYGYLFNSKEDTFQDLPRICGIEFEALLTGKTNKLIYPSLVYIFNSLERVFRAEEPVLLVLDEAWKYLQNEFFSSYIERWLKILRKKNAFVFIASQNISDFLNSPLCNTIMTNTYTRIYIADSKAKKEENRKYFTQIGVPDYVVETLSSLPLYSQIVEQEDSYHAVDWLVGSELENLVTTDEEKRVYRQKYGL